MKPAHALIACSLLGSIWLASCSSGSKRKVNPATGEAGEAGEVSYSSGGSAGNGGQPGMAGQSAGGQPAGGQPAGGEPTGGQPAGGTPPIGGSGGDASGGVPSEAGAPSSAQAGEPGAAGQPAIVAEGGQGGMPPVCFNDLDAPAAGAPGEAGAAAALHKTLSCNTAMTDLVAAYDPLTGNITLNASALGPVASGTFTFYYTSTDGETQTTTCGDSTVQVVGNQITLPTSTTNTPVSVELGLLQLTDECGGDATLSNPGQNGTCFDLTFLQSEGTWIVECNEGNCETTCAAQQQLPP